MNAKQEFVDYIKSKSVYLWGAGKMASAIVDYIERLGIKDYSFIDSDRDKHSFNGRPVYFSDVIKKNSDNNFIIVSCLAFDQIEPILNAYGYKKNQNYIDGLNFENTIKERQYKLDGKADFAKRLTAKEFTMIEQEMRTQGLSLETISLPELGEKALKPFEEGLNFREFYNKAHNISYNRKIMEYWFAYYMLDLNDYKQEDVYIDVGSSSTPWAMYLREQKGIQAYGIDLIENPLHRDYFLIGDATRMPFENHSVRGISMQSSFCLFEQEGDVKLIKEYSRVLKTGGKVIISPLYMYTEYISAVSAEHYGAGYKDNGQTEMIRDDCPGIRMSRYYDVKTLKSRILDMCSQLKLKYKIYVLPNEEVPVYDFAYLKFVLELEKM